MSSLIANTRACGDVSCPVAALSDMANLSWARNAVLEAATRELQYEARHGAEIDPSFTRDSGGVFESKSPHIARNHSGAVMSPDDSESRDWPPYEGAQ
jgi:hypothetical protein